MKNKTQIIILVLCIVISLTLSTSIYVRGHNNSCSKCQIDFTTTQYYGITLDEPRVNIVNVTDLYSGLLRNECIIKWDKNQGYYG